MSLTAADVAEILRLVDQSVFDELTLDFEGTKLHVRRSASGEAARGADVGRDAQVVAAVEGPAEVAEDGGPAAGVTASGAASPGAATRGVSTPGTPPAAAALDSDVGEVSSPLLGTYYRAAKPGAVPYVEVGTDTEEDTIVGIIEVMKLMNAVRAGIRGTVTDILVADGALAEYGQALLRIRRKS